MKGQAELVIRLPARAKVWRVVLLLLVTAGIVVGTWHADDRTWPFAPMTQFAFKVDPNGTVHSLGVEADTVTGQRVIVPLGAGGIGLERAEIEGQAPTIIAEPHRLQAIAIMHVEHQPETPRYARVFLVDTVSGLRHGIVAGTHRVTEASWTVRDPQHPGSR